MRNFEFILLLCFCFFGLGATRFSQQSKIAVELETPTPDSRPTQPGSGRIFSGGKHGLGGIKNAGIRDLEDDAFENKTAPRPAQTRFSAQQNRQIRTAGMASTDTADAIDQAGLKPAKAGNPEDAANLPPGIAGLLNI